MTKSSTKKPVLKTSKPVETLKQYKSAETVQESDDEGGNDNVSLNGDGRNEVKLVENGKSNLSTNPERSARSRSVSTVKVKSSQKHKLPVLASSGKVDTKVRTESISSIKSKNSGSQDLDHKDKSSDIVQHSSKSETETGSESESGSEDRADPSKKPSIKEPPQKVIQPYKPPQGFEVATITLSQSSVLANLFSPSSLHDKQIWHITTPSSVPISSIKELSSGQIASSAVLLSHQGSDYGLIAETLSSNENEILLLPSSESNDYKPTDIKPSKILRLQQLKSPTTKSQPDIPQNGVPYRPKKPARQQPKGLRMRYRPFGDYSSSSESGASEPSSPPKQFRIPPAIETTPPDKKRKRDANEFHDDGSSARRSKKVARVESETKTNFKGEVRKSHHDGLKKKEREKKSFS